MLVRPNSDSERIDRDQSTAGCATFDYEEHDYSERALKLLESEEGQLNTNFAGCGSLAQQGQLFEDLQGKLLGLLNVLNGVNDPDAGQETDDRSVVAAVRDVVRGGSRRLGVRSP